MLTPFGFLHKTAAGGSPTEYTMFEYATPAVADETADPNPVRLGVHFSSSVAGSVTAIVFYKGSTAGGNSHTVGLYQTNNGTSGTTLATKASSGETSTGWQRVDFDTPVSISAGTEYQAVVLWPGGRYPYTSTFFTGGYSNGYFSCASNNGNYQYTGSIGLAPFYNYYQDSNYFTDIVFVPS